jgi:formylglycine-generating enzyme required for sulfatase activity
MVKLDGGHFLMGTDYAQGFPDDGEGPVRTVELRPFLVDRDPVTNEMFAEFVRATHYRTEAGVFGWSFVFAGHLESAKQAAIVEDTVLRTPWWCKVPGADWRHPEGPDSSIANRLQQPAVHVSWNDAVRYTRWARKRLPTEAEWEYAARAGLEQKLYPWGDELTPNGQHLCNIWQGVFPEYDTGEDGWTAPAPVDAFPPNGYGLRVITGNAWEWCADWFHPAFQREPGVRDPAGPQTGTSRVIKGGSYLCHESYCNRYRVGARSANTPDSSTTNMSFRCVMDI